MPRDRLGAVVGAVFGLVFVLVNSGAAGAPWATVLRVLGALVFVAVLWHQRRYSASSGPAGTRPGALRTYWTSVVLEVVALVAGTAILSRTGHGEYGVAWVALVVGVHFLPFASAFDLPSFRWLGASLIALGVAGTALGVAGLGAVAPALVAGVGSGFVLMGFASVRFVRNDLSTPAVVDARE